MSERVNHSNSGWSVSFRVHLEDAGVFRAVPNSERFLPKDFDDCCLCDSESDHAHPALKHRCAAGIFVSDYRTNGERKTVTVLGALYDRRWLFAFLAMTGDLISCGSPNVAIAASYSYQPSVFQGPSLSHGFAAQEGCNGERRW